MPLRPLPFSVSASDPFARDSINRRAMVESLCQELRRDPGPLVVAVDGGFGSGKTVFLNMCAAYLKQSGTFVCEFDAWQQSHTKHPLVDIIAALIRDLRKMDGFADLKKREELIKNFRVVVTKVVKYVGPHLLAASGIPFAPISNILRNAIKDVFCNPTETSPLDEWSRYEDTIREFRDTLSAVVTEPDDRLIILIDELDRCMPQHAIDILNVVHHLFDCKGVAVVLGVNHGEIVHRVKHLYGQDCDGEQYLRRFCDKIVGLQRPVDQDLDRYMQGVFDDAGMTPHFNLEKRSWAALMVRMVVEPSRMSLRDIIQQVRRLDACLIASLEDIDLSQVKPFHRSILSSSESKIFRSESVVRWSMIAAWALRIVDEQTYEDLIVGSCDIFNAAAVLYNKLHISDQDSRSTAMKLVISLITADSEGGYPNIETVKTRLEQAGVADDNILGAIWSMWRIGNYPWSIGMSLSDIDSKLRQ